MKLQNWRLVDLSLFVRICVDLFLACADHGGGSALPASLTGVPDLGEVLGVQEGAGGRGISELLTSAAWPKDSGWKGVHVLPVLPPRASLVRCSLIFESVCTKRGCVSTVIFFLSIV